MDDAGPLCLACADLAHLVFLASGDAALTRRAKKASGLSAVVVRFSRARKRYERQGILVEEEALERAEADRSARQPAITRSSFLGVGNQATPAGFVLDLDRKGAGVDEESVDLDEPKATFFGLRRIWREAVPVS